MASIDRKLKTKYGTKVDFVCWTFGRDIVRKARTGWQTSARSRYVFIIFSLSLSSFSSLFRRPSLSAASLLFPLVSSPKFEQTNSQLRNHPDIPTCTIIPDNNDSLAKNYSQPATRTNSKVAAGSRTSTATHHILYPPTNSPTNPECMIPAPHLEQQLPVGPLADPSTPPGTSCPRHVLCSAMEA